MKEIFLARNRALWFVYSSAYTFDSDNLVYSKSQAAESQAENHCCASDCVGWISSRSYRSKLVITTSTSTPPLVKMYGIIQLNFFSIYVSVLKISIVLTDSVSKSRPQSIFFSRAAIVSVGKYVIFYDNNRYKQRQGPPVLKRRQFSYRFSRARVPKWGRKREKRRKRRLAISAVTIRFTLRGWNATNFDRKTLLKPNEWHCLFKPSKVSLNSSV